MTSKVNRCRYHGTISLLEANLINYATENLFEVSLVTMNRACCHCGARGSWHPAFLETGGIVQADKPLDDKEC